MERRVLLTALRPATEGEMWQAASLPGWSDLSVPVLYWVDAGYTGKRANAYFRKRKMAGKKMFE
jgi:hypothetical protein